MVGGRWGGVGGRIGKNLPCKKVLNSATASSKTIGPCLLVFIFTDPQILTAEFICKYLAIFRICVAWRNLVLQNSYCSLVLTSSLVSLPPATCCPFSHG